MTVKFAGVKFKANASSGIQYLKCANSTLHNILKEVPIMPTTCQSVKKNTVLPQMILKLQQGNKES